MRSNDFLSEGAIKARDFYEKYRFQNFVNKIVNKEPFHTVDGKQVVIPASRAEIALLKSVLKNNFDLKDPNPKSRALGPVEKEIPNVIGGVKLSSLEKTKEFGGTVGRSETGELDVTKANLGPTVEALKSFAIYAKLVMRGKKDITAEDVIKIGKLADEHSKVDYATNPTTGKKATTQTTFASYTRQVHDENKKIKDVMTLKVALSTPSFQRAVRVTANDKAAWGNLQGIISYVNTESDIGKYSRFFTKNNKRDPVNISVVGIGGAKTDISSTYVDPQGQEKPLKNLSMSVKSAGAEWYDQASGGNEDGMRNFYNIMGLSDADANQAMADVKFRSGGKADTTPAQFQAKVKAVTKLYSIAYNQLKARIPQLNDEGEADYVKGFLARLKQSIAGDETLVYVKFDAKGTYEKLKPNLLAHLAEVIDLDVNISTDATRPRIFWIDRKTGKTLIYAVLLVNEPNMRLTHQFNLGKDFFELMRMAANSANEPEEQPAVSPTANVAPAPKAPVPAMKVQPKVAPKPKAVSAMATPAPAPTLPATADADAEVAEQQFPNNQHADELHRMLKLARISK